MCKDVKKMVALATTEPSTVWAAYEQLDGSKRYTTLIVARKVKDRTKAVAIDLREKGKSKVSRVIDDFVYESEKQLRKTFGLVGCFTKFEMYSNA